ncbi:MAG: PPC domain-containing protein [Sandaracinus sp.]
MITKNTFKTIGSGLAVALGLGSVALGGCCMGGSTDTPVATTDPSQPVGTAPATTVPGTPNPTTIAVGAPPITVNVTAAPRWTFAVAAPGEFQFDAVGMPADAQLSVLDSNGWTQASDSDSGEGYDARLATFLAPGTYTVRVNEYNHAAATVNVTATQLAPMTPVATIAPGAPATTVTTPAADWDRPASAEVAITIATAGSYRINAAATDSSMCTSRIELIQNNASITSNSYGGPNSSAQIDQTMSPGTYTLRIRDTIYRACTHSVTVVAQ